MKRILAMLLLLSMLPALTACVPTPEQEVVISKAEGGTAPVAVLQPEEVPNTYQKTLTENKVTVTFDAAVFLPESDKLPSYRLAAAGIPEEQLPGIVNALFDDAPVYENGEPTKEELYPELLQALEELERVEADPDQYEGGVSSYQTEVNELQAAYNAAPDADSLKPAEITYAKSDVDHSGVFGCRGDCKRSSLATLFINTTIGPDSETSTFLTFRNPQQYYGLSFARATVPDLAAPDPIVTQEMAIGTASALIARMGIRDLKVSGCEPGVLKAANTGWYTADPNETPLLVFFTRSMNGMQVTLDAHIYAESSFGEAYVEPMAYERLTVGVDSQGVCFVQWNGPTAVTACLTENCKIISLDQAAQQAAKYLSFLYPVSDALNEANTEGQAQSGDRLSRGSVRSCEVRIDRIVLGWMQVREGDSPKESRLVPVWDFFGKVTRTYENGESETYEGNYMSLLTLDAQTGARIDRIHGY